MMNFIWIPVAGVVLWFIYRFFTKAADRVIDAGLDKIENVLEKQFKATLRVKKDENRGMQITAIVENNTDKGMTIDRINFYHPKSLPPKDHKIQDKTDYDWKSGNFPMMHRFQRANFNMDAERPPLQVHEWWDVDSVEIIRMIPPKELKIEVESVYGKIIVINGDELKAAMLATMAEES